MKSKTSVLHHARKYLRRGWQVIPVPYREKGPHIKKWQELRLDEKDLSGHFAKKTNVGILLGKPSHGLGDIDLDCEEAIKLAPHFLPDTDRIHGRKSKRSSHYWYYAKDLLRPEKFNDIDGACLLEVRFTGQQTIVPPSVHPSGERLHWEKRGRPPRVPAKELLRALEKLAAASILARHWPRKGSRNQAALALAGVLLRAGWEDAEVQLFIRLVAMAAEDEEWKNRGHAASSTRKKLERGEHTTGRPKLGGLMGKSVVDKALEWLGIQGDNSDPTPRVPDQRNEWPEPLSEVAFYGLAGTIAKAIEPITEADVAGLLSQFLVTFGSAAGRSAYFLIGSAKHHTNLFGVLVGRTAKARKGTSWAEIESLFGNADRVWAARCLLPGGLASGEGLVWAVRDPVEKQIVPKKGSTQSENPTKVIDLGVDDKRLHVVETEFASLLRVMRRDGNILSSVVRRAWDRGNLANQTKQSPARATGAHVSIIGHITRDELLREFSASDGSNGFANRFLWVCVRRSQLLPFGGRLPDKIRGNLIQRLQQALVFARKAGELRFTKLAKKKWRRAYKKLSCESPGLAGAITNRSEAQVLRLAMIYALLDRTTFISTKHLRAAIEVWRYCADSARHIFGDSTGDFLVDKILKNLRRSREGLTRTEIRELFSRNRSEAEISNALRVIAEQGLGSCEREETGGRPSERWYAAQGIRRKR